MKTTHRMRVALNKMIKNKDLKKRILEISYKNNLSHLGSCLTAVDIIKEIYDTKRKDEKFVLSSGHAGLALYTVIESMGGKNAADIFRHHGVHPDRCRECGLDYSTGSLGQGLPAAVGMALADRTKNVYCLISDGEAAEGSIWEAFHIAIDTELKNLHIYYNYNGWGAYRETSPLDFCEDDLNFNLRNTNVDDFPFLAGQAGHYATMTEQDYCAAVEILQ